jgi:NTP pyrophosphatase (non-canonical NTP hydrolase)
MSETTILQRAVAGFVEEAGIEAPVEARLLDLVSEVGELGDVLFSLVCIANTTGVDLGAALDGALGKYRERLTLGDDAWSGR